MVVTLIKVSEEIHDFEKHYWVGMEASITPEEDAVEQTKVLRKKLEQIYSSDIKIENKPIPAYIEVPPNISHDEEDRIQEEWNKLVKAITKLKYKEPALEYLSKSKEWMYSKEAKDIANSLPSKNKK